MTAEHTTWLAEEDDGTVTAMCHQCDWQGTERVSNRAQAGQEAELHTATKAGRTERCPAGGSQVIGEHEGNQFAVCPYCGLTVEVSLSLLSRPEWRYQSHDLIVEPEEAPAELSAAELADWWETTKAAVEGGPDSVRWLNERARIQAMSEQYRTQKRSAS